jgi:hypothetical protein
VAEAEAEEAEEGSSFLGGNLGSDAGRLQPHQRRMPSRISGWV